MPRVVSKKTQLERLTSLMEENTDLARGLCPKVLAKPRWEKISGEINSLGPPVRSSDAWQRVWNDLKYKTKKKSGHNHAETIATGGGPNNIVPLSNLEETVNRLMSYSVYNNPPGEEFGGDISCENETYTEPDVLSSHAVQPCNTPKKKITRKEDRQIALLQRQVNEQSEFQKETLETLKEIKKSLSNIESYHKKTYYLKKDKLALYKKKLEAKIKLD